MVAVRFDGLAALRLYDDGAIQAGLLLKPRVAVIPIGAGLANRELLGEGFPGRNTGKADPWHAIHVERQNKAVPVNGT